MRRLPLPLLLRDRGGTYYQPVGSPVQTGTWNVKCRTPNSSRIHRKTKEEMQASLQSRTIVRAKYRVYWRVGESWGHPVFEEWRVGAGELGPPSFWEVRATQFLRRVGGTYYRRPTEKVWESVCCARHKGLSIRQRAFVVDWSTVHVAKF